MRKLFQCSLVEYVISIHNVNLKPNKDLTKGKSNALALAARNSNNNDYSMDFVPHTIKTKNTDRERAFFLQSKQESLGTTLIVVSGALNFLLPIIKAALSYKSV